MKGFFFGLAMLAAAPALAQKAPPVGQIKLPVLSYTIEKSGPATGEHPKRSDLIRANYTLTTLDGTVIDTTEGKMPAVFPLGQLIPGWQILVQLMRPGDVWNFYVPPEYGYGPTAKGTLPANSFLVFKVELIAAMAMPGQG